MNPDATRTRPLGVEIEFHPAEIALVAHIPSGSGGAVYWLAAPDRFVGDEAEWPQLDRAVIRAVLLEAIRCLDQSEPTSAIGAGR